MPWAGGVWAAAKIAERSRQRGSVVNIDASQLRRYNSGRCSQDSRKKYLALRGPSSASMPRNRFCRALAAARRALLHHFRVLRPAIAIFGLCSSAVCAVLSRCCSPAPTVGARRRSVMMRTNESRDGQTMQQCSCGRFSRLLVCVVIYPNPLVSYMPLAAFYFCCFGLGCGE